MKELKILAVSIFAILLVCCCGERGPVKDDPADHVELPYATLVTRSLEELRLKTTTDDGLFGIGDADWNIDQDTGEIPFTSPTKGIVAAA